MLAAVAMLLIGGGPMLSEVSGVQVSCLENLRGKEGRARIEIVVGSGALHETEEARGVAHLVEHLLMRPLGFDDKNAVTGWDYTTYFHDVRAAALSTAAIDLVRALAVLDLAEGSFELERGVVVEEMRLRGSVEALGAVDPLFGGTILARDPGGSEASVRALTRADAIAFHAAHYLRSNIVVVARGAVDCDVFRASLAPALAMLREGAAPSLPRVSAPEPGPRAMPIGWGGKTFVQGFYWYDSTIADEMFMQLIAEHLEHAALDELRKERGLTYSPQADVRRIGAGGSMSLRVVTDGRDAEVAAWYTGKLRALKEASSPAKLLAHALQTTADHAEADTTRHALALMRGEASPVEAIAALDDARLRTLIETRLRADRSFGSTTASRNVGSIAVLVIFAAVVIGAVVFAGLRFFRG